MIRKLVSQGHSAGTITLPVSWIRKNNLKKGDEIILSEKDNNLVISSVKEQKVGVMHIDLTHKDDIIEKVLAILYKKGYGKLHITYTNQLSLKKIEKTIQKYLPGYEITEFTKSECTIRSLSVVKTEEVNHAVKRTLRLVLAEADYILKCIQSSEISKLAEIASIEDSLNRVTSFYRRLINSNPVSDYMPNTYLYGIIRNFESIGDQFYFLSDFILKSRIKHVKKQIVDILQDILSLIQLFHQLYQNAKLDDLQRVYAKRKAVNDYILREIKKATKNETIILMYILSVSQGLYESYMYLFGMRL